MRCMRQHKTGLLCHTSGMKMVRFDPTAGRAVVGSTPYTNDLLILSWPWPTPARANIRELAPFIIR